MSAYARLVESLLVEQQVEKPTGPVKSGTSQTTRTTQQDVEDKNKITPIDGRKPKDPKIKLDPEQAKKGQRTTAKRGTPEQEVAMRGTRGIARAVDDAGDQGSLARRLASRYSDKLPAKSGSADKIRNFRRGMDTISKGAVSGVKKALNFGRRIPTGGRSLV